MAGAEGTGTFRPQKYTAIQMTTIFANGEFCRFLQILKICGFFFGNFAVGKYYGHSSYTLRIASGHNEFGLHFIQILRICGFKDSKQI